MTRKREHIDYLRDVLEAAGKARQFLEGVSFSEFRANEEKIYAVVRALEIIGEATSHIPASVRTRYPELPWPDIVGMRNKLVHEYFGVDLEVVWRAVHDDLPPLEAAISRILADEVRRKKPG